MNGLNDMRTEGKHPAHYINEEPYLFDLENNEGVQTKEDMVPSKVGNREMCQRLYIKGEKISSDEESNVEDNANKHSNDADSQEMNKAKDNSHNEMRTEEKEGPFIKEEPYLYDLENSERVQIKESIVLSKEGNREICQRFYIKEEELSSDESNVENNINKHDVGDSQQMNGCGSTELGMNTSLPVEVFMKEENNIGIDYQNPDVTAPEISYRIMKVDDKLEKHFLTMSNIGRSEIDRLLDRSLDPDNDDIVDILSEADPSILSEDEALPSEVNFAPGDVAVEDFDFDIGITETLQQRDYSSEDEEDVLQNFSSESGEEYLTTESESDKEDDCLPTRKRKRRAVSTTRPGCSSWLDASQASSTPQRQCQVAPLRMHLPSPGQATDLPTPQRQDVSPTSSQRTFTQPPQPCDPWIRVYPDEVQRDIRQRFRVQNAGPKKIGNSSSPIDFFYLFMTATIWQMMVDATNRYANLNIARMLRDGTLSPGSHFRNWRDVSIAEMKKFWGLLLNMGLCRCSELSHYWDKSPMCFQLFYHQQMSLNRFKLIMSQFQVSCRTAFRRGHPNYDPWVKIRNFINEMNNAFKRHFVPSQDICINESMIGVKNRSVFIHYMPNKRLSRFGIQKFDLCDSASGYVMSVALYSGSDFLSGGSDPFTQKVVNKLMEETDLLNKWHHLFIDNYCTKIPLATFLHTNKTFLTCKINKNSLLSHAIKNSNVSVGETLYFRRGPILLVKYKERKSRKTLHLVSTAYSAENAEIVSKSGARNVKPVLIHHYNQHMGDVDSKDKNIYHLTCSRQTKKYWKMVVYNFVDMALYNAYQLYKLSNSKPVSKYNFMKEIVGALVEESAKPLPSVPLVLPRAPVGQITDRHVIQHLPKTTHRKCGVCGKSAIFWCPECNVGVHERCKPLLRHFKRR